MRPKMRANLQKNYQNQPCLIYIELFIDLVICGIATLCTDYSFCWRMKPKPMLSDIPTKFYIKNPLKEQKLLIRCKLRL